MNSRLDQVFSIFQARLETTSFISIAEPFTSDDPPDVGGSLCALTLSVSGQPFALLGVTEPSLSPQKKAFVVYITRRAHARRLPFTILCNERETFLIPTPKRDDEPLQVLRHYPPVLTITPNAIEPLVLSARHGGNSVCL